MNAEKRAKVLKARLGRRDELVKKINEALSEAHVLCEGVWYEGINMMVEIDGDWKHDHLRANYILFEKFGLSCYETVVTEEDGSDSYAAIHRYMFEV